ncbi:hypothetical protein V2J09_006770 [Rumex salicifolius]
MGNCQAVDTATLVIQHPSGKIDKLYWSVTAGDIMKANPGHFVALLITTTLYHPQTQNPKTTINNNGDTTNSSLRVTRVKLLRPTETLALGHVYRLITNQEVMNGLVAKKQAKLRQNGIELADKADALKDIEKAAKRYQLDKNPEATRQERQRSRTNRASSGGTTRSKAWQPSLNSIHEVGS